MNKSTWAEAAHFFLISFLRILKIVGLVLPLMTALRLFAHFYYGDLHDFTLSTAETLRAYFVGLRFDLSALSYLLILPVLLNLTAALSRSKDLWQKIQQLNLRLIFTALFFLALCLGCDTAYYSYFQDHFNVLMFGLINDDTKAVLLSFWRNYPIVTLTTTYAIAGFFTYRLLRHIILKPYAPIGPQTRKWTAPFRLLLPIVIMSLTARGSLGLFPLSVQDTVVSSRSFLNHQAYNGFHAFFRAIKLKRQENTVWNANLLHFGYIDPKAAFADYFELKIDEIPEDPLALLHHKTPKNAWAETNKPHVLVIMMESFGSAYFRYDNPDFQILGELKKHFAEDFLTLQFLPGHGSTIGSLSSFMISAPQRPNAGFLTESDFLQVPFRTSSAHIFKAAGYNTRFVYGGNPGWRDINKFAKFQGYDSIEGDVDISKELGGLKEHHDWGVFDEDVFNYLEKTLAAATTPQMVVTMTTTNHPPYQIPSTYQLRPLHAPKELDSRLLADRDLVKSRFQAYQYSNQKLGEFLTRLKNSPLKDKLIVAVTGDHSFWMVNFSDQELMQKWGVPFYLYIPSGARPAAFPAQVFGSHLDIFPTIYPLALSETEYDSLGQNLLAPQAETTSCSFFSGSLAFSKAGGILAQKGLENYAAYKWEPAFEFLQPGEPNAALDQLAKRYKALMSLTDYYFMRESQRARQHSK